MAERRAPAGQFLLLELDPGLHRSRVTGIFHHCALLPGIRGVSDLSMVPIELLNERILLRLSPEEQQVWASLSKPPVSDGRTARGRQRSRHQPAGEQRGTEEATR